MAVLNQISKEVLEDISKNIGKDIAEKAEKEGIESAFKAYAKEVGEKKARESWGDILKYRVKSTSAKSAALAVGGTVIGGKYVFADQGLVEQSANLAFGKKGTKKITDTAGKAADHVKETASSVKQSITGIGHNVSGGDIQRSYQGSTYPQMAGSGAPAVGGYIGGAVGNAVGNGMSTAGGFINNLSHGNVSSMSLLELIASSYMCFGRFGLLTKALGALIAGMTLKNNSQAPSYDQSVALQQQEQTSQSKGIHL